MVLLYLHPIPLFIKCQKLNSLAVGGPTLSAYCPVHLLLHLTLAGPPRFTLTSTCMYPHIRYFIRNDINIKFPIFVFPEWYSPTSCDEVECQYGALCQLRSDGTPECMCDLSCDNSARSQDIVCGTDNQNYGSECQLKMFACRLGTDIAVAYRGPCRGETLCVQQE